MIIASRTLKLAGAGADTKVVVELFQPVADQGAWTCNYVIHWPEYGRSGFAAGVDGVQALQLALQRIGVDLYTSDHHRAGRLVSGEAGDGYGFPVPKNIRDLLVDDGRIYEG